MVNCLSSSFAGCSESFVDGVYATTDEDDTNVGIGAVPWRLWKP